MTLRSQIFARQSAALLSYYSGLNNVRQFIGKKIHGQKLTLLAYHGVEDHPLDDDIFTVSTKQFDEQMRYLKEKYKVISISEARKMKCTPESSGDFVIITFDDGYRNNYNNAVPILKKYELPACFFLTTGLMSHVPEKALTTGSVWKYAGMTWNEVKALRNMGFEIGAHTCSHPNLLQIPLEMARNEIIGSKKELEQVLGETIEYFAYPGGRKRIHYDDAIKAIVAEKFSVCCTTSRARNNLATMDMLELSRICVQNWWSLFYFARELEGTFDFIGSFMN
jgi:peptidoglycan/xylan/chitin deacetylase (PgdA/CDA1 family)